MKIAVFGIGYVGAVSAACLATDGNEVIAVDPNPTKVSGLNSGASPIVEPGLDGLIATTVAEGSLRAVSDARSAILGTDLSLICVGTPNRPDGSLDTAYVVIAAEQIGAALKEATHFHSVVFRSTILPGTMEQLVIPALEATSGKRAGVDFGVGYYPEFLRESTAIKDYYDPGTIVFGTLEGDTLTADRLRAMNAHLKVEPIVTSVRTAEAVKYTNNCWHALKVSFANEIGNISKACGIDGHEVMAILCADKRLNISTAYMKPGFAFGGSCLPKDLRAIRFKARELDVPTPVLDGVMSANSVQLEKAFGMVTKTEARHVGLIGLSFKPDTDDLRESPFVSLVERLLGSGYQVSIYDPNINLKNMTPISREIVSRQLPHIEGLLHDELDSVLEESDVIVLGSGGVVAHTAFEWAAQKNTKIVDLVRISEKSTSNGTYEGICW